MRGKRTLVYREHGDPGAIPGCARRARRQKQPVMTRRQPMYAPPAVCVANYADRPAQEGDRTPDLSRALPDTSQDAPAGRRGKLGFRRLTGLLAFVLGLGPGLDDAGAMQAAPKGVVETG